MAYCNDDGQLRLPPEPVDTYLDDQQEVRSGQDGAASVEYVPSFMDGATGDQADLLLQVLYAFAQRNSALGDRTSILMGRPMPGVSSHERGVRAERARTRAENMGRTALRLFGSMYGEPKVEQRNDMSVGTRRDYDWYELHFGEPDPDVPRLRDRERSRLEALRDRAAPP